MMAPPNLGGPGSQERTDALAHNGGIQRRNSIDQAIAIHAGVPGAAPGAGLDRAGLEAMRVGGFVPLDTLMAAIPPGSEQHWNPNLGGGRAQIRTGRNFQMPSVVPGAQPFGIRVHTNDNTQPLGQNAGGNAVLRVTQGNQTLLSAPIAAHVDARQIGNNWAGARTQDPALINSAHIPLVLPPPAPPVARGFLPPVVDAAVRGVGALAWHASGASQLVGGAQQLHENAQPGGTWSGMAVGAARMAVGGAVMATLATSAPAKAIAGSAVAGVASSARFLGIWR